MYRAVHKSQPGTCKKHDVLFAFKGLLEKWANKLIPNLDLPLGKTRPIIEKMMKWVLIKRNSSIKTYTKNVKLLKTYISSINYTVAVPKNEQLNFDLLYSILGQSKHSKNTEPYFFESVYKVLPESYHEKLELNDKGQIINLFSPINANSPEIAWHCISAICNLQCSYIIQKLLEILKLLLSLRLEQFPNKTKNVDLCTNKFSRSTKLGHSIVCHQNFSCSTTLLFLRNLGIHFPSIRNIVTLEYNLRRKQNIILKIDKAFCAGDVKTLQTIESHTIQNVNSFYINNFNFDNEDDIID
ncbi:uncharacterized protein FWK35_00027072 [Aphis craccivora]|uniref:Uncharacterized protein n=1 Tax=Aphis craccivora TaxID=307492 RepID=A0A6G0W602_APHCR|nr:uncharacterized protein FWK35_00027072 [Aphis craccivora]